MIGLVDFVVLAVATYRLTRFLQIDTIIEGSRDRFYAWLMAPDIPSLWRFKVEELITCPWCLTVWTAAGTTVFWSLVVDGEWLGWAFPLVWLAVAGASLVVWEWAPSET